MKIRYVTIYALLVITLFVVEAPAQNTGFSSASVGAVSGDARLIGDAGKDDIALSSGSAISPWRSVSTSNNSKLLINWGDSVLSSLGELTSVFYVPDQESSSFRVEMIEGMLRTVRSARPGSAAQNFSVQTPMAVIHPTSVHEPVDFIVELYDPSTTIITVLGGSIRVQNLEDKSERTFESCQNIYIAQGKNGFDVVNISQDVVGKLVSASTIEGTINIQTASCSTAYAESYSPVTVSAPSVTYVEEPDILEYYPYEQIQIVQPAYPGGEWVAVLPGIGRWFIPFPTGYDLSPAWVQVYIREAIFNQTIYADTVIVNNIRQRAREINNYIIVAQGSGNIAAANRARRELAHLRTRENLVSQRVDRLRKRVDRLQADRPGTRDANIVNVINNSLQSNKNSQIARTFEDRLQRRAEIDRNLARVTSKQVSDLRTQLAQERDPMKRTALRSELEQVRNNINQGKIPVPKNNRELAQTITGIAKADDPQQMRRLQNRLQREVSRIQPDDQAEAITDNNVRSLQESVRKTDNPEVKNQLSERLSNIQESIKSRPDLSTAIGAAVLGGAVGSKLAPGRQNLLGDNQMDRGRRQDDGRAPSSNLSESPSRNTFRNQAGARDRQGPAAGLLPRNLDGGDQDQKADRDRVGRNLQPDRRSDELRDQTRRRLNEIRGGAGSGTAGLPDRAPRSLDRPDRQTDTSGPRSLSGPDRQADTSTPRSLSRPDREADNLTPRSLGRPDRQADSVVPRSLSRPDRSPDPGPGNLDSMRRLDQQRRNFRSSVPDVRESPTRSDRIGPPQFNPRSLAPNREPERQSPVMQNRPDFGRRMEIPRLDSGNIPKRQNLGREMPARPQFQAPQSAPRSFSPPAAAPRSFQAPSAPSFQSRGNIGGGGPGRIGQMPQQRSMPNLPGMGGRGGGRGPGGDNDEKGKGKR